MYEPTKVEVCRSVAERVRESGDIIDATTIMLEFWDYVKHIGYVQGREDEKHSQYHGEGVRI